MEPKIKFREAVAEAFREYKNLSFMQKITVILLTAILFMTFLTYQRATEAVRLAQEAYSAADDAHTAAAEAASNADEAKDKAEEAAGEASSAASNVIAYCH